MKLFNTSPKNILFFIAPVSLFLLASCSSYQYSGYETDGIYGEANPSNERQNQYETQGATQNSHSSYYKDLFAEEAALYGDVLDDNSIFTDVESYSSTGEYIPGENQQSNYAGGNAPWGNDPDSYSINIYNHSYYGGFYNPYWGGGLYAFDPFWGPGYYGPGFYGGGFYGHGYWGNSWRIGFGGMHPYGAFGYGYGAHPFFYGGGGYYNPYNFYGNRFHDVRAVAYNTGRRDATSSYRSRSEARLRNVTNLESRGRTSSYSRSIRNLRNSNDNSYGTARRSVSRDYSNSRNADYNTSNSRSQTINRSTRSRSSDTYSRPTQTRSQTTTRSSTPTVRSSGTSRSSGTVRSSGTTRSSSGTSSRGRRN